VRRYLVADPGGSFSEFRASSRENALQAADREWRASCQRFGVEPRGECRVIEESPPDA
jgi:hypothetical protein